MATIKERLQDLLDQKDEELETAQNRISTLEQEKKFGLDWMLQRRGLDNFTKLPIPRLEMRIVKNELYYQETEVCLLVCERDRTISEIPLSYSKRSGGSIDVSTFPATGVLSDRLVDQLPGTLHDACFHSENTGIPAFIILAKDRQYRITSFRPLKLESVFD